MLVGRVFVYNIYKLMLNLKIAKFYCLTLVGTAMLLTLSFALPAQALTPLPTPDPKVGGFGVEATKPQPPPTRGATITTPGDGASFTTSPITVSGICPTGLLVELLNNGVMVGSVMCENGSFRLEVSLFAGINELQAIVYDDLDQAGPKSNIRKVTYTNTNFAAFGDLVTLTSSYGRRSAQTGSILSWPLQLSGGAGPYAFSIDWGDGSDTELMSQLMSGVVNIQHTYKRAGIYKVNIKVTDVNGVSAFLQVIAVSSGKVEAPTGSAEGDSKSGVRTVVLWIPAAISLAMIPVAYWLGRRSQIVSLRNKMLKERDIYQKK